MSLKQFVEKETDGHLRLAKHVIASGQTKNLAFSPLSIHVVLAMIASGSSGSTRAQLLTYFNSQGAEQLDSLFSQITATIFTDGGPLGGPVLSSKNGLWLDASVTLKPAYRNILQNCYKAVAENADFHNKGEEATKEVNAWAEEETKGLIKDILAPNSVTKLTRLICATAVYFKGKWDKEFNRNGTYIDDFHLLDGTTVGAQFMTGRRVQFVRAFDGFKVARLPYKQGNDKRQFSMYIYLPDAIDGLTALLDRICSEPGFIDRHLPDKEEFLEEFRIPRFKIGFKFEASEVLKGLGVVDLFEMGGLREMVEECEVGEMLRVDRMLHKAVVEVNEEGTKAVAVTVGFMDLEAAMESSSEEEEELMRFVADRPFLFTIREDGSGVVLFVGQLLDPLADGYPLEMTTHKPEDEECDAPLKKRRRVHEYYEDEDEDEEEEWDDFDASPWKKRTGPHEDEDDEEDEEWDD